MPNDPSIRRLAPAAALALAALLAAGCADSADHRVSTGEVSGASAAAIDAARWDESPVAAALDAMGPDTARFHAHVMALSNEFFEGRAPGTHGNLLAQDYIQFYFTRAGLEPAFSIDGEPTFRQPFNVSGDVIVTDADFAWTAAGDSRQLEAEEDFNVLGISGTGNAEGDLVFVGYSIDAGPDDYTNYPLHSEDLNGKIALILRFEPMDENGKSKWQDVSGWSNNASLLPKIRAAVERGAAGVILVGTPGADDDRATRLESAARTRFGTAVDVPVVMMSVDAADTMLKKADAQGRSLKDLRLLADEKDTAGPIALNARIALTTGIEIEQIPTANVGAVLRGKGALANEYVVIGAHYDHLGYGQFGSRARDAEGVIHPGADDNASGTSGVLMLAEDLHKAYEALPDNADARSILFLTFSAEESGLNGSRYYTENPSVALSQISAMINMDMIGRLRDNKFEIGGVGTAEGFEDFVRPIFDASGIEITATRGGQGPSDHASFYAKDIPVLFLFTGLHEEYHTPQDVGATVNFGGGARIAELAGDLAMALATRQGSFTFTSTGTTSRQGAVRGVSVRLGIAPGNYADDMPGVTVGEVYEGTSAADAGIQKGDRIIRWGGEELPDVGAMMERLAAHKPGDVVEMVIVRNGVEQTVAVTMKARAGRQ